LIDPEGLKHNLGSAVIISCTWPTADVQPWRANVGYNRPAASLMSEE